MLRLQVRTKNRYQKYQITISRGILAKTGTVTRSTLGKRAQRIGLISNKKVFSLYGATVTKSLESSGFLVSTWLMGDGERFKTIAAAERALSFLSDAGLQRSDGVVALGGGVVSDLAGFVAAVYLRGVRVILIPTTLLAQIDSSVGGKTGVNLPAGKNLVGAFHQPSAVISDVETLDTLPSRELVAGWCECVKQGAVAGKHLFGQTTNLLKEFNSKKVLDSSALERLIAAHCAFKASIVEKDEREDIERKDSRSRRILNFGHTVGHALEAVTGYRRFRHGEAVGHGMLVAGELSKNLGLLSQTELELLRNGVDLCGPLPPANDLEPDRLIKALARDKKVSSGKLQWVLLERVGRPRLVDEQAISTSVLKRSLADGLGNGKRTH